MIATFDDAGERSRVTGHRGARRLLCSAGLRDDAVDLAVDELQTGHAVLLVDFTESSVSDARARREDVARAA